MVGVIFQLALDLVNLDRALEIAREAEKYVDWVEVGTPLIKSEGLDAVRAVKKAFPNKKVVADMKTIDTGALEVEIASKAGADIIIFLGAADDSTIAEAVRAAKRYNAEIMVDLLNVENIVERARKLEELNVNYICVHVGIDQQMRGISPMKVLKELSKEVDMPLAVAGGINSETAAESVRNGAEIVIVGGAVTKTEDCGEAARIIKEAMEVQKPIRTRLFKRYEDEESAFKLLSEVSTPNISDAMQKEGTMQGIVPAYTPVKVVGRAFTVKTMRGDWAKTVEAVDKAEEGDVIVIDAAKSPVAVWGELASYSAKQRKIAGVVIDGGIRDIDEIKKIKFPAFARYINPEAGEPKGYGELGGEIVCGGVKVRPRDVVVGDDNGVVIIPKERVVEVANRAMDVKEREIRYRKEIKKGKTLGEVLHLERWEKPK